MLSASKAATLFAAADQWTGYCYRVGYLQKLRGDLAAEFEYLNEGHFDGHHRDGYGLLASYRFLTLDR